MRMFLEISQVDTTSSTVVECHDKTPDQKAATLWINRTWRTPSVLTSVPLSVPTSVRIRALTRAAGVLIPDCHLGGSGACRRV